MPVKLLDGNFGAANGFAGEEADTAALVVHDTIAFSVDSEVAGHGSAFAVALGKADLAYDNLALANLLAAKDLNA